MSRGLLMVELAKKKNSLDNKDTVLMDQNGPNLNATSCSIDQMNRGPENVLTNSSCANYSNKLLQDDLMLSEDDGSSELYEPSETGNESSSEDENRNINKVKKITRWKKSDPNNWEKNKIKARRKSGLPYKTKLGLKAGKKPKDVNCDSCRWKCSSKFDDIFRKEVCSAFWKLDYCRQKDFIINYVSNEATKTRRIRTGTGINKKNSRVYFLQKGDERIRVCKQYFLKTLSISHGPVEKALAGVNEMGIFAENDKRGKKEPPNKTDPAVIQRVKNHIESFPAVDSHYCRKTTKRQYLDPNLSIKKMYQLYVEEAKEKERNTKIVEPIVSEITYRRCFGEYYNLSFFQPKKDQCITCKNHENPDQQDGMKAEYEAHIKRKNEANKAKNEDKLRAMNDNKFISVTFDLQSVLQLPSSQASQMYYSRKICVYNLTIYESAPPHKGYCFVWSELNGQRGSCEIGTALLQWILQIPNHVIEISLFSDTCSGQNRNQFIASLFLYVVQNTHIRVVEHKFLEKGHSYMECDSMHSSIESAKKHVSVYSLNDWINIFLTARSCRGKNKNSGSYIVKQLNFQEFIDFKSIAARIIKNKTRDTNGEKVNWLKIKVLRYEKERPGIIMYKYSHEDSEFRIIQTYGRGRPPVISADLPKLYKSLLPISEAKKKDLIRLCSMNAIPEEFHAWYKSLPVDKKQKDCAPEPAASDDSDECLD